MEQGGGGAAHLAALHRGLKGVPGGVGEELVALVAGMHAVHRPERLERGLTAADPVDRERNCVAHRRAVGGGQGEVGVASLHARRRLRSHVPLEGKDHLHDGHAGLGHEPPQDRLVAGERFRGVRHDVVVGGEVEEHEIGFAGEHVAVEAKHAELRAGAADRRVVEAKACLRILPLEPAGDLRPVGGAEWVRRVGSPGERGPEEHHLEAVASPGPPSEVDERRRRGGLLDAQHPRVRPCRRVGNQGGGRHDRDDGDPLRRGHSSGSVRCH